MWRFSEGISCPRHFIRFTIVPASTIVTWYYDVTKTDVEHASKHASFASWFDYAECIQLQNLNNSKVNRLKI